MLRRAAPALIALVALASGCTQRDAGDGALPGHRGGDGALTGAGATFPFPLYSKWISEFSRVEPGVRINYQSIGSGGGVRQLIEHTVDFGASDAPMTDEQLAKAPGVLHIPTCLGAVVLSYNLEGVPSGLRLAPETAAGIFLGTITDWSDPALTADNPGVTLPKRRIVAVHRSDGSGTTKIFTDWLDANSPAWKKGPGAGMSVEWPSGLGAKGNEGVSGQVASTPGAIGYVELVYATQNKLPYAAIKNAAGAFVMPAPAAITAAGDGALPSMPDDLRATIVDSRSPEAYPIAGFTYVLLYARQPDAVRGKALVDFLSWSIHDGQAFTVPLSYAPLPSALIPRIEAKLRSVTGPDGQTLLSAGLPGAMAPKLDRER